MLMFKGSNFGIRTYTENEEQRSIEITVRYAVWTRTKVAQIFTFVLQKE